MQQYNKVVCDEAVLTSTLAGRYPFQHSEWKAAVTTTGGAVDGELIRATFLSGGSVYTSHAAYLDALPHKASDIERGVILTDTEVAHNCEGIRLFVELDYRTATQLLPTWDEALTHIRLIARTVHECFPARDALLVHIAVCTPKRKVRRTNSAELAWGVHLVFPDLVTTTTTMVRIAQLLDTRLSNAFPQWSGILDPASYRSRNATLRPCFSYKMSDCPICATKTADPLCTRLRATCACYNGRCVSPSIYTYAGSLLDPGAVSVCVLQDTLAVLRGMSIIPPRMGEFTPGFTQPHDMSVTDGSGPSGACARASARGARGAGAGTNASAPLVQRFERQAHTDAIDLTRNPKGYQTLLQTITPIHTAYAHVAIHKVFLDTKRRMFIVVVKGNGSRYCLYRHTTHTSNRVFFCVNLMRGRIYTHCFDPECKRRYGTTPLSQPLSRQDKSRLTADFALPETSTRPTLTCASASANASAVVDTETRRTKWLDKVRTYQLLLHAQE